MKITDWEMGADVSASVSVSGRLSVAISKDLFPFYDHLNLSLSLSTSF